MVKDDGNCWENEFELHWVVDDEFAEYQIWLVYNLGIVVCLEKSDGDKDC